MDFLTHLFLPITIVYVLDRDRFADNPLAFGLAGFAVFSDFDKILGLQGLLHSLVVLAPLSVLLVAIEARWRNDTTYATLAVLLLGSHLLLDFIDGGPVTLFYPFIEAGIGLQYPTRLVVDTQPVPVGIRDSLVTVRTGVPDQGRGTYPFITGYGVLSMLMFVVVVTGMHFRNQQRHW